MFEFFKYLYTDVFLILQQLFYFLFSFIPCYASKFKKAGKGLSKFYALIAYNKGLIIYDTFVLALSNAQ